MNVRGVIICLAALAFAQVPWIPCHCGDGCEIRPLLVAETHACEHPAHAVEHNHCLAHGCLGHRHHHAPLPASEPEPEPESPDHDHEIYILQAVSAPASPSVSPASPAWGAVVSVDAFDATFALSDAPRRIPEVGTGPPAALTTVCLLL